MTMTGYSIEVEEIGGREGSNSRLVRDGEQAYPAALLAERSHKL